MSRVLAYDLGGSSLRVAVVDGLIVRRMVRIPQTIERGPGGEFEADPNLWWENFCSACQQLQEEGEDLGRVEAVAGCGFTRTQILVDAAGEVVHPAITFQDSRGTRALAGFLERAPSDLAERAPGLSPFHPITRLLWVQGRCPDIWARVAKVLEPKDFLNLRLTGEVRSDLVSQQVTSAFFDVVEDDPEVKRVLDIPREICPDAISPFAKVGRVKGNLPDALLPLIGKPVYCGSNDTWTCVLGSGGLNPGAAYGISGTSDVFGVITNKSYEAEGLLTVRWGPEQWQLGGPSQGAATKLSWARDRFFPGLTLDQALVESFSGAARPPLFLPYLEGERTPFWDPDLRGAFLGLNGGHGNGDMFRAVAEGLNFLSRLVLERAEAATGEHAAHVCFSGGLANSATLCQLKADILNRPVFVPVSSESGLIGAAQLFDHDSSDIERITDAILTDGAWYRPDPGNRAYYDDWFDIFKSATDTVRDTSRRIAAASYTHN